MMMNRSFLVSLLLVTFTASVSVADGLFPMVNDDPPIDRKLNQDMFDFLSQLLGSARLAPHLKCGLKTRATREVRKFSDGQKWIEQIEVEFRTNHFDSGQKVAFKIPMGARYGVKKEVNQWAGRSEVIKIELGDYYEHWLRVTHDGKGSIVGIQAGNIWRTYPCELVRD